MTTWIGFVAGIALIIAIVAMEKFYPATVTRLFGPKTLSDGRKIARVSKAWCIFCVVCGALVLGAAVFGFVTFLPKDDIMGALVILPVTLLFGLPILFFLKALTTDLYTVYWDEDEISGPSEIRALGWKATRTTIAMNDIKRQGHSLWFSYIESVDGKRIHWTGYHWGHTHLEAHIKSHIPDDVKRNLFSRLMKL
ncbi:hypothetical protein [Henriciella sp.]|uniref:hypothetical protein n=1 Tax=Henriciella sp. TaxID=1968823 RepID=UPI00260820EC|nr:hypothetical protein [Henriciella sp.]